MYPTHPAITEAVAAYRRQDFEHHAAAYRMTRNISGGPRQIPAIRRTLGRTAISVGVRLLAQEPAPGC